MFGKKKHTHHLDIHVQRPNANQEETVAEFNTGIMLLKKAAIEKEAQIEKYLEVGGYLDGRFAFVPAKIYFRPGTKLNWDYARKPYRGEAKFFKRQADLEVDFDGNPVPMNTAADLCGAPGAGTGAPTASAVIAGPTLPAGKSAAPRKRVRKSVKKATPRRR